MIQIAKLVWQLVNLLARGLWWLLWPLRWLYGRLSIKIRALVSKPFIWLWTTLYLRFKDAQSDEKWGYFVWGVMAVVVATPEISAAVGGSRFPFRTISGTTGHLEDLNSIVAIVPVAIIAMLAVAVLRFPSEDDSHAITVANDPNPMRGAPSGDFGAPQIVGLSRSRFGRLMRNPVDTNTGELDLSDRHTWDPNPYFTAVAIIVIVSGLLASISNDPWITGYVIYGEIAVFWIIVPNILSAAKRDMPFRTLFFTLRSLEYRLRFVVYIVAGGLAILFVHLALYPWPDLSRESSVYAGLSPGHADEDAIAAVAALRTGKPSLKIVARDRAIFEGREAWVIYFGDDSGRQSGCFVRLTQDPTPSGGSEQVVASDPCQASAG